ncbi:aldo/keto reductase [Nocardia sp. CDC160]|uniref:aldo/keto reductase n=1 Tax=Nocardia sp. CDC160 TaxID=3112166 RepID=UPI002DBAC773|nr:aldo/keto reductase [Nocardia sp. CDC160]MEC3919164.1 aldo/keto reductase [Nocardia sp. CDC160]
MEYTRLGRTGLSVSRLCLGTMNFGPRTDEPDSHRIMDHALDHGVNLFDTANSYGRERTGRGRDELAGKGRTEQIIGRWFARGGGRREKVVLATKVWSATSTWPNDGGLSARHLITACEDSLRRLSTDWIDLYQMHHVDRNTPWEEIWQAMQILVSSGKVRYVGSANFAGWHLAAANESAARRNFLGLVSEQCLYNLLTRHVELEVLPAARQYGIGVLVWSPLAGGVLAGAGLDRLADPVTGHATQLRAGVTAQVRANDYLPQYRAAVEHYERLAAELGATPAQLGLGWLLAQPAVTAPIVGPRSTDQLDDALGALDVELTAETHTRLDELFPPVGNGGPAPEAWAW